MQKQEFDKEEQRQKTESDKTTKKLREARNRKKQLIKQIEQLNIDISKEDTQIKKCEDELIESRTHKHFLDVLAIRAEKKEYRPKKKPTEQEKEEIAKQKEAQKDEGGTFMTGISAANNIRNQMMKNVR